MAHALVAAEGTCRVVTTRGCEDAAPPPLCTRPMHRSSCVHSQWEALVAAFGRNFPDLSYSL
eukprot:6183831-Pleurochrysis_carterae.AAC.3